MQTVEKPINTVQARAMVFIIVCRKRHGVGPTRSEVARALGWKPYTFSTNMRFEKLRARGVIFTEEPRSLDVSKEGRAALSAWQKAGRAVTSPPSP